MLPEQLALLELPSASIKPKKVNRLNALVSQYAAAMEDWPQHEKEQFLLEIERLTVLQFLERFSQQQQESFALRLLQEVLEVKASD